MIKDAGRYFKETYAQRGRFLGSLTYKESARLTEELVRFYSQPIFQKWKEEDNPICLARALKLSKSGQK